jgi:hypothetical protein
VIARIHHLDGFDDIQEFLTTLYSTGWRVVSHTHVILQGSDRDGYTEYDHHYTFVVERPE